jgi:hypothetical protein
MATENAAVCHTTADEEEVAVAMNWQSDDSNNNGSDNSGSHENTEDELGHALSPSRSPQQSGKQNKRGCDWCWFVRALT